MFFAGLLLKLVFSVWLGWLPVAGRASTRTELAMGSLAAPTGIYWLDAFRSGNLAAFGDVAAARGPARTHPRPADGRDLPAAGAHQRHRHARHGLRRGRHARVASANYRLVTKHAYKPALIPIITVIGLQIALLLGGAVLTETTFEWKGLGFQLVQYLNARDFVAVQGIVVLLAVIVAVTNFIVDVIAALIDPRVRY